MSLSLCMCMRFCVIKYLNKLLMLISMLHAGLLVDYHSHTAKLSTSGHPHFSEWVTQIQIQKSRAPTHSFSHPHLHVETVRSVADKPVMMTATPIISRD